MKQGQDLTKQKSYSLGMIINYANRNYCLQRFLSVMEKIQTGCR